jgi:hypothetical protein
MATPNDLIEGLEVLGKYLPRGLNSEDYIAAEGNVFYVNMLSSQTSEEDAETLRNLEWYESSDTGGWALAL